jgi:alpha-L-arabinofuranosidase
MRDAMIAGVTLNVFNNHSERVKMANLAQTINVLQAVILTKDEKIILTPTYHVMEMYNVHQGATSIPLKVNSNDYTFNKENLKAVSVSASIDSNKFVHISLVNIDAKKNQDITIDLRGIKPANVSGKILLSDKIQDHNTFENPEKIRPVPYKSTTISGNQLKLSLPPASVVVLELK